MSYHHTHCASCGAVLPIKYGMPARCRCSATPAVTSGVTIDDRLRAENARLVQRGVDDALRIHALQTRVAELQAELREANRGANPFAKALQRAVADTYARFKKG